MKSVFGIVLSLCVAAFSTQTHAGGDALDQVKNAGVIKIGVNTDYRPFGMRDQSGQIVGIEPDLARDIGKRLGVKVEMVPVQPANRIQFLQQGRIDVILASMTYNQERAKVVDFIQPFYYAGGTGFVAHKGSGFKSWTDLHGKTVCGVQGTYYNRAVSEKYGVNIAAFADLTQAINALLNNSCVGFVEDSTVTAQLLSDSKLKDFDAPLPPDDVQPWGLAVAKQNANTPLSKFLSDTVASWHKSGELINLEKKWGLPSSEWLQTEHKKVM
ncbi:Polar amino acid uptake family ABC transporter, periplasmic substrate-binding protein [Paraburkholderia piptadeniae]|uniref:Polar amino acid uptake family ABC transporter, periplasmic substrate-binding protein n=1 Tax=Paraburkholderia piptadeniae TaxID=1701573 RepID=A0A1N7S9K0_9BURK|nr:transporter substrate-binding domain-containing protein [Paraburkholderia piptadeniae]SIT44067.1 Polar amino acid uptake family ABC transporter, periplasmic substrate-binding protein [Paraburkholderia piptadeniae]